MALKIKRKYLAWAVVPSVFALVLHYSGIASAVWAINRSTDHLLPHRDDPRVLYEPGAEELAGAIARSLSEAIDTVESKQYRPFEAPVKVHVCATIESFRSYCPGAGNAGGCVFNQRLFISPKPENTVERMPRLVTHELSHLHMEQRLGVFQWLSACPQWFQEGLAVYVSDGGGAETVTEQQAREEIAAGRHFALEPAGRLLGRNATMNGMRPHMFYRQAGMFLAYLHEADESRFKAFLIAVQAGEPLAAAFEQHYGKSLEAAWQGFVRSLAAHVQQN